MLVSENFDGMDIEQFREYCLSRRFTSEEGMPFGDDTVVFRVCVCAVSGVAKGKLFALVNLKDGGYVLLRAGSQERAEQLREQYSAVEPGWHMNKKYWNGFYLKTCGLTTKQICDMVDESYDAVVSKMPAAVRKQLATFDTKA